MQVQIRHDSACSAERPERLCVPHPRDSQQRLPQVVCELRPPVTCVQHPVHLVEHLLLGDRRALQGPSRATTFPSPSCTIAPTPSVLWPCHCALRTMACRTHAPSKAPPTPYSHIPVWLQTFPHLQLLVLRAKVPPRLGLRDGHIDFRQRYFCTLFTSKNAHTAPFSSTAHLPFTLGELVSFQRKEYSRKRNIFAFSISP